MKIACLRCKRALAEYAATDRVIPTVGALAGHLAKCGECARERDWFQAAHRDLKSSLTAEQAAAGFTDSTWARFSASTRPHRSYIPVLALSSAACAAVIAAAILVRNPRTPPLVPTPDSTASAATKPAPDNDIRPFDGKANPGKPTSGVGLTTSQSEQKSSLVPGLIRHHRVRHTDHKRILAYRKPIEAGATLVSTSRPHFPETQTISWDQMASWYEYQGDYRSAAAAYIQAAREDPTDSRVFNAGRASECAGDVAQAIEYYARFLKHEREQESHFKQQEAPPRKGAWQWNENRDTT